MKGKQWLVIPLYWVGFVIYGSFLHRLVPLFPYYDFTEGSGEYHFGPCSFSIALALLVMILAILFIAISGRSKKMHPAGKVLVITVMVLSFAAQMFIYLDHFSYFYLFGHPIPILP